MNVVEARGVRKTYESEGTPVRALRGLDMTMDEGEFVAVMGPSGCGKSTLLNLIAGLDAPTEGEIIVAGESLVDKDENELARMRRRHIGIVFQFFNLLEGMSVLENVTLPAVIAGTKRRQAESRARDLLDLLGLGDKARSAPGRPLGRPAPAARHRAGPRQRADAPPRRRTDRRPRLRGRSRGARAVPPAARRRPGDPPRHPRRGGGGAGVSRIIKMRDGRVEDDGRAEAVAAGREQRARRSEHARRPRSSSASSGGRARRSSRARWRGLPPALLGILLAAVAMAGALSAPLVDRHGDTATQVVRAIVVGTFALAGAFALSRRPSERQPILALLATALAGAATSLSALLEAHAHGDRGRPRRSSPSRDIAEPVALALFPVAIMHFLLGLPDGSCRLSRAVIGIGLPGRAPASASAL